MTESEAYTPTLGDYIQKLGEFEVNGMNLHRLHLLRGTLSGVVLDREGQVIDAGQEEGGTFENVGEHTAMAMLITDVLGEAMGLAPEERAALNVAAWMHDSGKKTERMWQKSIEVAQDLASHPRTRELLKNERRGLRREPGRRKIIALEDVARMEEWENVMAGIPQRSNVLAKQNVPPTAAGHGTDTAAKIMWFADATLSGTSIVPIQTRFDNLEKDPVNGPRNVEFSNSYATKYGEPLYGVQRRLGTQYEQEFSRRLGIQPTELYTWLNNKVQERIKTQTMPKLPAV